MIGLPYQWRGIDEALTRIHRLRNLDGLSDELEAAADEILPIVKTYPAERAGSRYVRKYRFRDAWRKGQVQRSGGSVRLDIDNNITYGPLLVSDEQADIHVGRWWKLRTVAEEQRGPLRARVQTWALRTWRGR